TASFVEIDGQPLVIVRRSGAGPAQVGPAKAGHYVLSFGPLQGARAGTVTRLATDVDFGPARFEPICRGLVVFLKASRVAVGAHVIPVLCGTRPVQLVVVRNAFVRVEMKPPLAALFLRARVPRNRERLDA